MGLYYGKGGMLYACFNVVIFIVKICYFRCCYFVSNIVQSLTGFAGVMLSIPPSMLLFGPDMVIAVINALCWGISVVLAWRNRRYLNLKGILTIVGFMLAGMAIGVKLYSLVPRKS